jgi:hypothetical protein
MPTKSGSHKLYLVGGVAILAVAIVIFSLFFFREGKAPPIMTPSVSPPPASSVSLVDKILRELNWGNIAFTVPSTMRYKHPQLVELVLSSSLSIAQLQAQLEQKEGVGSARVRISNRMEAQLTGSGFQIQALTPELQAITSEQTARWRWEVVPAEPGSHSLHLTLSALIDIAGRDTPLVVRTYDQSIEVKIAVSQRVYGFFSNNWQWLWATVLVPIALYLWRRWKKRPEEPKRGAP